MAAPVRIEPGAEAVRSMANGDLDIVQWLLTDLADPTPKGVMDATPGNYGDVSDNCPGALLTEKRFGGILGQETDGTFTAIGIAIYRVSHYSGGARPYAAYARRLADLAVPVFKQRQTNDENGTSFAYDREYKVISRPVSSRVKTKFVYGITDDQFSERVDPLVGALFYFTPNGQPYILAGADGIYTLGSPLRAEYRFLTSCAVPAFPETTFANDVFIPPLAPLEEYKERRNILGIPEVVAVGITSIYRTSTLDQLPGFQ